MYSSIRHEPCGLTCRSHVPFTVNLSDTDRIEHSACPPSTSASTSTAPLTPQRDTQRQRVHLARFAILLDCMQTPYDGCHAPAILPARLAWRVPVERDKHMELKISKCGFSSLGVLSALTWSARKLRSHPNRRSIATPALSPNAPARC